MCRIVMEIRYYMAANSWDMVRPVDISSLFLYIRSETYIMKEPIFRLLNADEIECRVGTVNEKGLSLLLYKDARVDFKILDETFGPYGWQRTHQEINGNLYCTISIWDEEKGQWISKQDVGTKSDYEQEKGQASDSFKRAAVCTGIGRELYTAPFIWVSAGQVEIRPRGQGKGQGYTTSEHFSVKEIGYNDRREINRLVIVNSKGQRMFSMKPGRSVPEPAPANNIQDKPEPEYVLDKRRISLMMKELERTGVSLETVLERYHLRDIGQMTPEVYQNAMNGLKKTKAKDAA